MDEMAFEPAFKEGVKYRLQRQDKENFRQRDQRRVGKGQDLYEA